MKITTFAYFGFCHRRSRLRRAPPESYRALDAPPSPPDLHHKERAKHFGVSPNCIGYTMKKLRIRRKK